MAQKNLKECSTFSVNREMQTKIMVRFYLIPIRMSNIKTHATADATRMWRKKHTPSLLVELQAGISTLEINLVILHIVGNISP